MKKLLLTLLFTFSISLNAQWKGTTSNDDQRTMMIQRHMELYPKNDQLVFTLFKKLQSKINVKHRQVYASDFKFIK